MPAPTPYILVHCPTATVVTRVGLVAESSAEPILLRSVRAASTLSTDRLECKYGDLYAEAWGNRSLEYNVALDQLAQYGVSDSYLGRFDPTLLNNLSVNFGIDPTNGIALLTQASRDLSPGKLAAVSMTIRVEDTRNAGQGSPDGPSTPAWGGTPGGTRPAITLASPQTGTIGSALSITVTTTGTATVTVTLAPGQTLPAGLTLSGGVISGTPTGIPSDNYIELRASNSYGSASKIIRLTIAAAAVTPPALTQVYVRYLYDSGVATEPDAFWAFGYSGMSPAPTSEASFYSATPTGHSYPAGAPGLPSDPAARTGTLSGRAWNITEILGWDGTEYVYWYQRASTDTALADALALGGSDVLLNASGLTITDDIGTDGPGDEADPAWPGTIEPSDRITQYFLYKNFLTNELVCGGLGGDKVLPDVASFLARYPNISLNWTETRSLVLLEIYNNGSSPGYLYARSDTDDAIANAIAGTESPVWYAGTRKGTLSTSVPEVHPEFPLDDLPTSPAWTGPAPDADAWCYVLKRFWDGGVYQCYGIRGNAPTAITLERFLDIRREITSRATHDEMTAGRAWVEEVWMKIGADPWKAYWLDAALTPSTSLIGQALASNVSPINHPDVAPGELFVNFKFNGVNPFDPDA
jgi:hypothetical protein